MNGEKVGVAVRKGFSPAGLLAIGVGVNRETLKQVATFTFPESVQGRLEDLLFKKREGQLSRREAKELEQLITQVQIAEVEKALATYLLSREEKRRTIPRRSGSSQ